MIDEDTKYKKFATKETPTKAKHKHEYVKYFCWVKHPRADHMIRLYTRPECVDCGHTRRTPRNAQSVTEVEVSYKEYLELK